MTQNLLKTVFLVFLGTAVLGSSGARALERIAIIEHDFPSGGLGGLVVSAGKRNLHPSFSFSSGSSSAEIQVEESLDPMQPLAALWIDELRIPSEVLLSGAPIAFEARKDNIIFPAFSLKGAPLSDRENSTVRLIFQFGYISKLGGVPGQLRVEEQKTGRVSLDLVHEGGFGWALVSTDEMSSPPKVLSLQLMAGFPRAASKFNLPLVAALAALNPASGIRSVLLMREGAQSLAVSAQ